MPVWCDVFGKVDPDRWLKYLSAVMVTLASRGSMGVEELVKTLKPVVMAFEARLIMEWAASLGVLGGQIEGCAMAVMEWWWVVVECQREGLMERQGGGEREGGMVEREREDKVAEARVVQEAPGIGAGTGKRGRRRALPSGRPEVRFVSGRDGDGG